MKYCIDCGSPDIAFKKPAGDSNQRHICQSCGFIFYENPKIVAGCILEWQRQVLLCQRAIEPRSGLWTFPAGFMENHESVIEAAARETLEEACATSDDLRLYGIYNLKHINQVYIIYRGTLKDGHAASGKESLQVALYREKNIPWEKIAFLVIAESLKRYFKDRAAGKFKQHSIDIERDKSGALKVTSD